MKVSIDDYTLFFWLTSSFFALILDFLLGIFPPDEYPEEVSTDEDDDMFGSRKRMKRVAGHTEARDGGVPGAKKGKATFTSCLGNIFHSLTTDMGS